MGFLHLFTAALEERNPEALLGLEQENLRKQLGNYNRGLSTHASLCERLITQVKRLENEERSLRVQTAALLRGGKRQKAAALPFDCRPSSVISWEAAPSWRAQKKFIGN
jgi:phage shock protein A